MDLLFKREQTDNLLGRIAFRLWAKVEMTDYEQALIDRYDFEKTTRLISDDSDFFKRALIIGAIVFILTAAVLSATSNVPDGLVGGALVGAGAGYWYLNEKRETIYVKDLLFGRRFKCRSVIDLAKKEALLDSACLVLRQVMETAKHWEGVERNPIEALSKQDAKDLIVRVF